MMPRLMQVAMTLFIGTFMRLAKSLAVTNSVSFSIRLSSISRSAASCALFEKASLFSLRHFALFFWLFDVRRARVSLICFCTSSSLTSALTGFFNFGGCLPLLWRSLLYELSTLCSMSIRSFLIRFRFLRSPSLSVFVFSF